MRILIITLFAICSSVLFGQNTFNGSAQANCSNNNKGVYTSTAPDGVARFIILEDGIFTRQHNPIYLYKSGNVIDNFDSQAFFLTPYQDGDPKNTRIVKNTTNISGACNFNPSPIETTGNLGIDVSWSFTKKYYNYTMAIFKKSCRGDTGPSTLEFYFNSNQVEFGGVAQIIKGKNVGPFELTYPNITIDGVTYNSMLKATCSSINDEQSVAYFPLKSKLFPDEKIKFHSILRTDCETVSRNKEYVVAGTPHDPNKVECLNSCVKFPATVSHELEYKITFQNTGDGSATNVVVWDSIGFDVDPNSIRILESSHPCFLDQISANYSNKVKFVFPDINLPGTGQFFNIAQEKTIGWVKFKICTKIFNGQCVGNKAAIYFDNQPPIITNLELSCTNGPCIAAVECQSLAAATRSIAKSNFSVYPNPVSNDLTIETNTNLPSSISIVNSLGSTVKSMKFEVTPDNVNVDMTDLSKGIYILQFESNGKIETVKLIKQ